MIISPKRRFIFVHIPKTGGTSMAFKLEARAAKDDILIGDTPKARKRRKRVEDLQTPGRLWKHARLADIDGAKAIGDVADYFVFTLVRDPWDRVFSLYHWLRDQGFDHVMVARSKTLSFDAFLSDPEVGAILATDQADGYLRTQAGHIHCDAFVRLEHFERDIAPVEAHLGFSLRPLPWENKSKRPADSRAGYSDTSAARIAEWFASDIQRFGYTF